MHRSLKLNVLIHVLFLLHFSGCALQRLFIPRAWQWFFFPLLFYIRLIWSLFRTKNFFFFFSFRSSGIEDLWWPGAVLGCLQTLIYLSYTTTNFSRPPGFTHEKRQGSRKLLIVPVHITSKWETGVKNQGLSVIRRLLKITILTVEMGVGFRLCRFPKWFICQLP